MCGAIYEKPFVEVLDVRFDEGILVISGSGDINNATEEDFGRI